MQGVEIDHRGKERIVRGILLEEPNDVFLHRAKVSAAAAMSSMFLVRMGDQDRFIHVDTVFRQMRLEQGVSKRLLGAPLGKHIQSRHQCGPPPMTFFSQISPRE